MDSLTYSSKLNIVLSISNRITFSICCYLANSSLSNCIILKM
jgi:hypothetical protein